MEYPEIKKTWDEICSSVRYEMGRFVYNIATPLSLSDDLKHAHALGTGNYVRFGTDTYLITNEHVVSEAVGGHLAHLPGPTEYYVPCKNAIQAAGWPIDVALMRLDVEPSGTSREILASSRFDSAYSPVQHELMFWLGFPGSKATRHEDVTASNIRHTWFGSLETPAFPNLVQEALSPSIQVPFFDAEKHVALHYPSKARRTVGGDPVEMPNPKGMSGSLLWDTKYLACTAAGKRWKVEEARVCGVVWAAHEKPEIVVATKIEYVRPWLLFFRRQECAYFHWIERGRPSGEALVDWEWAEQRVSKLDEEKAH